MKQFWRVILSRTFLIGVLVLTQIAFLSTIFFSIDRFSGAIFTFIVFFCTIIAMIIFEKDNLSAGYRMMWLLIIIPLPVSGLLYYLIFAKRPLPPKKSSLLHKLERRASSCIAQDYKTVKQLLEINPSVKRTVEYLSTNSASPVYANTTSEYFAMGEDFFSHFLQELSQAKQFIFMEFFIIEDDSKMWQQTLEILKYKAAQGVDIRILYDSFGSLPRLPNNYHLYLQQLGIKCYPFNELHFTMKVTDYKFFNHRDHRKLIIIDGNVGYSGGVNFADEYINEIQPFGKWKDTAFCLKGPAVFKLTTLFLTLWDFTANTNTNFESYKCNKNYNCDGFVQPYGDSPLDNEKVAENTYMSIINNAKNYIYIMTPYLIIDSEMIQCLSLAAKSGVDVRIITPGTPDKQYAFHVTQSYYKSLLKEGVRIFEYTPGFLHAKMYLSDDSVAIVGSANMDYRSLYLHFENCCVFYNSHFVDNVKSDFSQTISQSREITIQDTQNISLHKKVSQVFFRFFAPLM